MNQERMYIGVRSREICREVCCIAYKIKSMERTKTVYKKNQKWDIFLKLFYFSHCCSYHRSFRETTKAEHLLRVYSA